MSVGRLGLAVPGTETREAREGYKVRRRQHFKVAVTIYEEIKIVNTARIGNQANA